MSPDTQVNTMSSNSHLPHHTLPKLAVNGSNWVLYKKRMILVTSAKGLNEYLKGEIPVPPNPPTYPRVHVLMADEIEEQEKASAKLKEHWMKENETCTIIASTVPETTQVKLLNATTSKEMWDVVCNEQEVKTKGYQMEMRQQLINTRCEESADVQEHLNKLMKMRQELAGMGASLTEDDFTTIVVSSLPASYNSVTTSLYTSASMSKQQVSMEDINRVIEEEYTRHQIQTRSAIPQASALVVHSRGGRGGNEGSTSNKGQKKRERPCCTNPKCQKLGHRIEDCWAEGGGKEGQGPKPRDKGDSPPTQAKAVIGNDHAFSTVFSLKATDAEFTDGQKVDSITAVPASTYLPIVNSSSTFESVLDE
jgi:gag-polypeptide of LTR copia-type